MVNIFLVRINPLQYLLATFFPPREGVSVEANSSITFLSFSFSLLIWGLFGIGMGLSNFSTPAEGVLPVLVMNTIISVALFKNMVRSVLFQVVGPSANSPNLEEEEEEDPQIETTSGGIGRGRRISITRFESLCKKNRIASSSSIGSNIGRWNTSESGNSKNDNCSVSMECCVCLCRFESKEEVSELSCKHFFHKGCLKKWFDNQHSTCPLCRSMH